MFPEFGLPTSGFDRGQGRLEDKEWGLKRRYETGEKCLWGINSRKYACGNWKIDMTNVRLMDTGCTLRLSFFTGGGGVGAKKRHFRPKNRSSLNVFFF